MVRARRPAQPLAVLHYEALAALASLEARLSSLEARGAEHLSRWPEVAAAWEAHSQAAQAARSQLRSLSRAIADGNLKLSELILERSSLQRRLRSLQLSRANNPNERAKARLRRQIAALEVQLGDQQGAMDKLQESLAQLRLEQREETQAQQQAVAQEQASSVQLRALQIYFPPTKLYLERYGLALGVGHCQYVLGQPPAGWRSYQHRQLGALSSLYTQMASARYVLPRYGAAIAGRDGYGVEGFYLAHLLADEAALQALPAVLCAHDTQLDHIYDVQRAMVLQYYRQQRWGELQALLEVHQFAGGLAGALGACVLALLQGDAVACAQHWLQLAALHAARWAQSPTPAVGLVDVTALTLYTWAAERGMDLAKLTGVALPRSVPLALLG